MVTVVTLITEDTLWTAVRIVTKVTVLTVLNCQCGWQQKFRDQNVAAERVKSCNPNSQQKVRKLFFFPLGMEQYVVCVCNRFYFWALFVCWRRQLNEGSTATRFTRHPASANCFQLISTAGTVRIWGAQWMVAMFKDPNSFLTFSLETRQKRSTLNCFCIWFNGLTLVNFDQLYSKRDPVYKDFPERLQLGTL